MGLPLHMSVQGETGSVHLPPLFLNGRCVVTRALSCSWPSIIHACEEAGHVSCDRRCMPTYPVSTSEDGEIYYLTVRELTVFRDEGTLWSYLTQLTSSREKKPDESPVTVW